MKQRATLAGSLLTLLTVAGCASTGTAPEPATSAPSTAAPVPGTSQQPAPESQSVEGTVVRFTGGASVDVTIGADNATTRDFLSMLPLTLSFKEFNGREKIAYLPRKLETAGTSGSDPEDGDLIYFVPWGNLAFYYNTVGIGYSDQTVNIGTYNATMEKLERLENGEVTIEVVDR